MRTIGVVCLIYGFMLLKPNFQLFGQNHDVVNFKVDSSIYVKFRGNPTRYFYQTPLGDITIYEYKPQANANDSNCLYSIALYRTSAEEANAGNLSDLQMTARLNEIINADEMAVNNLNGKILSKDEVIYKDVSGIRMKILFSDLSELNEIEGQKNIIYHAAYFKSKGLIIKLWTYTPSNKENNKINYFFNSLSFSKN
jgi:hypothetical protein